MYDVALALQFHAEESSYVHLSVPLLCSYHIIVILLVVLVGIASSIIVPVSVCARASAIMLSRCQASNISKAISLGENRGRVG